MTGLFDETVSFGMFLARIQKGTTIDYESALVNNEVWMPKRFALKADGRALMKSFHQDLQLTYSDYRKFSTESRILTSEPAQ